MKILFYNWVDYLDDENRGGGVSVYQKNVLASLEGQPDVEALFLSSGISYDLFSNEPRWEKVRHGPTEDRERRFEIVNSGVLSPAHHSFGNETQIDHPATVETFCDFIETHGPFDVIHFNNLEGLPATVLKLKERFPETRVILSLHNYYPVCPQVNLWFQEAENCLDFDGGRKCESCLLHKVDERIVRLANAVAFNLKKNGIRPGTRTFDKAFMPALRIARRSVGAYMRLSRRGRKAMAPAQAPMPNMQVGLLTRVEPTFLNFKRRRETFTDLINTHCDQVLCVSDRVGVVAAKFGIDPALLRTSYIGTKHAEKFAETRAKETILPESGVLTLGYLGYMRRDKGFYFLLDALEALPTTLARQLRLVICARRGDHETMYRISALGEKLDQVLYADGYNHDDLDQLLEEVDVGLIPVQWEDNLPQVAIEMHARHIPLLTSDLGGAKELGNCPDMVFEAGDVESFQERVEALLEGQITTEGYWRNAKAPVSMDEHIYDLLAHYRGETKMTTAKTA
ncbi:glycosyltransferase [Thalassococcus sp. S3]|uniref:glycosyltransferase n=1 Tax=Thalassococcus sp. S3 TaxID=2017482 RepID=UPI001024373B|nr:glycosyltransferase [Thalassococcus sp. S3]QBF34250.1 glycosyltransferase [Thalassococcus sp. S3]